MNKADDLTFAREVVGGDPLAKHLDVQVEEVSHDHAVLSLAPKAHHLNSGGRVHGGTIYALMDLAAAVAANTGERRSWLVEGKVNFLTAAAPKTKLTARAAPVDIKRRLSLWEVRVESGGELVAVGQMMAYHFKPKA
jgi:acyl-CoA thioesterase